MICCLYEKRPWIVASKLLWDLVGRTDKIFSCNTSIINFGKNIFLNFQNIIPYIIKLFLQFISTQMLRYFAFYASVKSRCLSNIIKYQ